MEMEIEIFGPKGELQEIDFNFSELKNKLEIKLKSYEKLEYTDEQIKFAKGDRALLNALKKKLSDKRIEIKNLYLSPYARFEEKVKELTRLIDLPVEEIDRKIKDFEERRKSEKLARIKALWAEKTLCADKIVGFDRFFQDRMLNSTFSMAEVEAEIAKTENETAKNMTIISGLPVSPELSSMLVDTYKRTLNLGDVILLKEKIETEVKEKEQARLLAEQKREEEAEKEKEPKADPLPIATVQSPKIDQKGVIVLILEVVATRQRVDSLLLLLDREGYQYSVNGMGDKDD
jgi:hypothetical protein